MLNQVIDGRTVAAAMLEGVSSDVDALRQDGWIPQLVSIRIGDSPAVDLYVRNQKRNADKVGIHFVEKHFPVNISEAEVHATILNLNVDPRVTGIILQRPIPENLPIKSLQTTIHPLKDVEGMHPASIGNIVYRELELGPCTAIAAVELLKSTGLSSRRIGGDSDWPF